MRTADTGKGWLYNIISTQFSRVWEFYDEFLILSELFSRSISVSIKYWIPRIINRTCFRIVGVCSGSITTILKMEMPAELLPLPGRILLLANMPVPASLSGGQKGIQGCSVLVGSNRSATFLPVDGIDTCWQNLRQNVSWHGLPKSVYSVFCAAVLFTVFANKKRVILSTTL